MALDRTQQEWLRSTLDLYRSEGEVASFKMDDSDSFVTVAFNDGKGTLRYGLDSLFAELSEGAWQALCETISTSGGKA